MGTASWMRIAEMHRDAPFHLRVIDLPEFLGCQFQLKVTILQIGFQPCPRFIRVNKCALVRRKIIQQYRETKRKSRPKQKVPLVKRPERSPLTPKTSARPQPASPAAAGARQGCSWTEASLGDSHRGALRALQELGGAGPPPVISEMGTVWGPRRCHTFIQHAPIYTIGLICIHLQEFTRKI